MEDIETAHTRQNISLSSDFLRAGAAPSQTQLVAENSADDAHDGHVDEPVPVRTLLKHHALDWLGGILMVIAGFAVAFIHPNERYFYPDDESISYAWKEDTYPTWALAIPLPIVPVVVFVLYSGIGRRRWDEVHRAVLAMVVAGGLTILVTDVFKVAVGRLRPDFIDACQPLASLVATAISTPSGPGRSLPPSSCTGLVWRIQDSRQSFPSGHTSYSFCGMGIVSLYLWERLSFAKRRDGGRGAWFGAEFGNGDGWKPSFVTLELFAVVVPLMAAALIGVSRIEDNKHHWSDVFAGAIVGLLSAFLAWVFFLRRPVSMNTLLSVALGRSVEIKRST
ncbi:PAP2-domain-containing protein [Gonapodya prolifera JEL478]|uniref:PAP2-domain-containing protein n=1 Tax=Gonapodya prolifera (strain JEL478) TaxID=1344416 RepID=A0A138ZX61_GONPJ|nr:PAP2-domain-containing protein [Gonapodya prolifera JEL478]|eukprot:KXS09098.1 PAP2-domain-containing protein [Gonapodya prolifera JEL478]